MEYIFPAHGTSDIRRIGYLLYFRMSGLWNVEAFREAYVQINDISKNFGSSGFVKITDLREWEGATKDGLEFDAEITPAERSPDVTVVIVKNSFQRSFMKRHLDDAVSGKHPLFMEECMEAAIDRLVSGSYISSDQEEEIRSELLPDIPGSDNNSHS